MKKKLKDFKDKFFLLYGSNNKDFGNDGLLILSLVIFGLGTFFSLMALFGRVSNPDVELTWDGYMWLYMAVSGFIGGIFLIILYFYIYNNANRAIKFWQGVFLIFFLIVLVIFIPWIVFTAVIFGVISYRAKKSDNFAAFLMMLVADLLIVAASLKLEIDYSYIEGIAGAIGRFIVTKPEPTQIFLFFAITEIVVLAVNEIVFFAMCRIKGKAVQKETDEYRETLFEKIRNNGKRRSKKEQAYKNAKNDVEKFVRKKDLEIRYDITYLRNTLLKAQLFALIATFVWAILSTDPDVTEISSDIVNVVTLFTLIILYKDKRRELGSF